MYRKDFFRVLDGYEDLFKKSGFVKEKDGLYFKLGFSLAVELNQWGWDDENGWSFFMRVIDTRFEDKYGIFDWSGVLELTPKTINLDIATIEALYVSQPGGVQAIFQEGQWISFYDIEHLRRVLDCTIPLILKMTDKWIGQQQKKHFIGKRKVEELSQNKKDAIQEEMKHAFED